MPADFIAFIDSLIYGDFGVAELGAAPAGSVNHMNWSIDRVVTPPPAASAGIQFLDHHAIRMLNRYAAWRSLHALPPVRPWDGTNVFPVPLSAPVSPAMPPALAGAAFPAGFTENDLGTTVETYYNTLRHFSGGIEMADVIKAPYSYRYWAFMKWVADLRRRLLGQPVLPVEAVYDRDGTILSEKDFTDYFNQVHHVWHPNAGEPSWSTATPFFTTGVGQYRRKKQVSRTQVGQEFFQFHRDHLELFDRWLARTGQIPVPSSNMCGHDVGTALPGPPAGLDVVNGGEGHPKVNFATRAVDFAPFHQTIWEGNLPPFDGTLREFANAGEVGQYLATDFNPFSEIAITGLGSPGSDFTNGGYHGEGHILNGDISPPDVNNYVHRFFAWHGFLDDVWAKRAPSFTTFAPVFADSSPFPGPVVLTILREFSPNSDAVEPANAIENIDLTTGNGTVRCRINVRLDVITPRRPLKLRLVCDVLREAGGAAPVITMARELNILPPGSPLGANDRAQGADFVEAFVFDGSAGTVDAGGKGPFASSNLLFAPTDTGFLNSLIRISGRLTCEQKPDGTVAAAPGTITTAGTACAGAGTAFTTTFRQGDIIRVGTETRVVWDIASNTSLTLSAAFTPDIAAATAYARLDGFQFDQRIEIPLVQERQAPDVTVYLDHSTFSKDEVDASAVGGQSVFPSAFYVLLQDRTERAGTIVWPSDAKTDVLLPQFKGLIAPPVRASGLYPDLAHKPLVELVDAATDALIAGLTVEATNAMPEAPALHPSIPQRITYPCQVTFTGNAQFTGMAAGDRKELKLRITARDRSGNTIVHDATRVQLQVNPNPYMLDGPTPWLSVDTRVFQIPQGQARFGVPAGWIDPLVFIGQVIDNFRAGSGTAGGETFQSLPEDEATSVLEYSTQVGGQNIFNFCLSRIRLLSVTGANGVRCTFRLFRWGTANVEFDSSLAYRSAAASGIGLLGRTTSNELASIPFFANARVPITADMSTQPDPKNLFDFPPTGTSEASSFFGAFLDINLSDLRFPTTFLNDGPFNAVPVAQMRSIKDLLIGQHQCMIAEIIFPPDPTVAGATPGTSDNLSQRNLLIVQTANPGSESTRRVQHSFDIDLTRRRPMLPKPERHPHNGVIHVHAIPVEELRQAKPLPPPLPARPAVVAVDVHAGHDETPPMPHVAMTAPMLNAGDTKDLKIDLAGLDSAIAGRLLHLRESWSGRDDERFQQLVQQEKETAAWASRWVFDDTNWKRLDGIDELAFFWNNLPPASTVELYLPGCSAEEIINFRNLRHAPGTVEIIDSQTVRLKVQGPVYVPVPRFYADHLAGLVTITLPPGIKKGQKFLVDVLQFRSDDDRALGAFQIRVQVGEAKSLIEPETRMVQLFHQRLGLTPPQSRWRPVLERQVQFFRDRARGFVDLATGGTGQWVDPTETQKGTHLRVVLERIIIHNDREPFFKGKGEFSFVTLAESSDNGSQSVKSRFPEKGHFKLSDRPGKNSAVLNAVIFSGWVESQLALEILGTESDLLDPDDKLPTFRRTFTGNPEDWLGSYGPTASLAPENLGEWSIEYRIERG
jgi:hypothetical protein